MSAVDRSLQNLSLNLKNHYSLEMTLPSTSTPASILGSPVAPSSLGTGESYLNLLSLDKGRQRPNPQDGDEGPAGQDGLGRSVEGSEVSAGVLPNGTGRQRAEDPGGRTDDRYGRAPGPCFLRGGGSEHVGTGWAARGGRVATPAARGWSKTGGCLRRTASNVPREAAEVLGEPGWESPVLSFKCLPRPQQPIPKINPPPPVLRKRSSKTSPSLEVEAKPKSTVPASPRGSELGAETRTPVPGTEQLPLQGGPSKDRVGQNGHASPAPGLCRQPTGGPGPGSPGTDCGSAGGAADNTPSFSVGNETCLHISFSEDELLENEPDEAPGPRRVPA